MKTFSSSLVSIASFAHQSILTVLILSAKMLLCVIECDKMNCRNYTKYNAAHVLSLLLTLYSWSVDITECLEAVCDPTCKNNGTCIKPNECDCNGTSYTGPQCTERKYCILC